MEFDELVREYGPVIRACARKVGRRMADELTQEGMIWLWQHAGLVIRWRAERTAGETEAGIRSFVTRRMCDYQRNERNVTAREVPSGLLPA